MISIYKIECLQNNKVYVGQTSRNINKRFNEHIRGLKYNHHFNEDLQEDYNKYGLNNFTFEILEEVEDNLGNEREDYWMQYYGGIDNNSIYNFQNNLTKNYIYSNRISNSNKGREAWNKGRKMTETEIEVNRKSHLGIKRTLESRIKQSCTIRNNPNWGNKGKHLSEKTKQRLSQSLKGREAWNKGRKNKSHKYDYIVPKLREEYQLLKSYSKVKELHPDIRYDTLYRLIKFGDTNNKMKCNDYPAKE